MRPSRAGITLVEMALALGVGMVVVFGAFAIVDAASKVIGAARKRALEEELISSIVRYLRQTPISVATPVGVNAALGSASQPGVDITGTIFGATSGYPEDWPRVLVGRLSSESIGTIAKKEIYTIRFLYSDADVDANGIIDASATALMRPALIIPIVRLP